MAMRQATSQSMNWKSFAFCFDFAFSLFWNCICATTTITSHTWMALFGQVKTIEVHTYIERKGAGGGEEDSQKCVWVFILFFFHLLAWAQYEWSAVVVRHSICVISSVWKSNATLHFHERALIEFNKKSIPTGLLHNGRGITMYVIFNYPCRVTVQYADFRFKCHLS